MLDEWLLNEQENGAFWGGSKENDVVSGNRVVYTSLSPFDHRVSIVEEPNRRKSPRVLQTYAHNPFLLRFTPIWLLRMSENEKNIEKSKFFISDFFSACQNGINMRFSILFHFFFLLLQFSRHPNKALELWFSWFNYNYTAIMQINAKA